MTLTLKTRLAILTQPGDQGGTVGENALFTVEAQGEGLTYRWYFKNANATLPSGVKKDFLPRFVLRLFGFSSTNPNDIAISRRGRSDLMRPSSEILKLFSYR